MLAGDNAIVVGMAAAGLQRDLRRKAIVIGIAAAAVLRIVFALFTTQLLGIIGLTACRRTPAPLGDAGSSGASCTTRGQATDDALRRCRRLRLKASLAPGDTRSGVPATKTIGQALSQIVVADVSMSLDNVLAVAGTARHHLWVLVVGLALSVALMGIAATLIARMLRRMPVDLLSRPRPDRLGGDRHDLGRRPAGDLPRRRLGGRG